ncbi:MAG: peptide MFS transporter [Ferruginibacter sp.]
MIQETIQKKHPKGLWVLFGTEMWERFNFYGMRAILTLFIAEALGKGDAEASIIYGGFLGLCYLTPMLGGYISDKYLGNRNCIILGGLTMGIGQLFLFLSSDFSGTNKPLAINIMWFALLLVILGNGFFKPNISSMVGFLYPKEQKNKLDSAFTIFYLGINVGSTLGQFICPFFGDKKYDGVRDLGAFKWGFLAAAIAMFLGVLVFYLLKNKYIRTPGGELIGTKPKVFINSPGVESEHANYSKKSFAISAGLAIVFTYLLHQVMGGIGVSFIKSWLYPFIFAAGIALAYLILSEKAITKMEKDRIWVLYIVCFFVMFFWGSFEQAGSSLTFIADKQTDTNFFGWEMPPTMVQNFNGIFVMIFAIPFSMLWIWLNKRKLEPLSPVKQAIGLLLIALGYLIIALQVKGLGINGKIGVLWLVVLYLLHTWGELCLSPIGLSLVSKLAPKRFASILMGVWFLGNAGGYVLTGVLGALLPPTPDKYIAARAANVDLSAILDGTKTASGYDLFYLGREKVAANINYQKALANELDFEKIYFKKRDGDKDSLLTQVQLDKIQKEKLIIVQYPEILGFKLKSLYDFFMMFVILCGIAGLVLLALTPLLKKMMHGVR